MSGVSDFCLSGISAIASRTRTAMLDGGTSLEHGVDIDAQRLKSTGCITHTGAADSRGQDNGAHGPRAADVPVNTREAGRVYALPPQVQRSALRTGWPIVYGLSASRRERDRLRMPSREQRVLGSDRIHVKNW